MNVLVINQYAANKGDRAVAYFVVRELARNGVDRITLSTHEPSLWPDAKTCLGAGVELIPWAWDLGKGRSASLLERARRKVRDELRLAAYAALRRRLVAGGWGPAVRWLSGGTFRRSLDHADLVISTGGHHVTTLLAPEAVSGQIHDMAVTLLAKKPLVLWSQSIGPLEFAQVQNREFVRRVLVEASAIYTRDEQSRVELENLGIPWSRVRATQESVLGLNDLFERHVPPSCREPILGIAVYATQKREPARHSAYVETLAKLVDHAVERGLLVRFFPMEIRNSGSDDRDLITQVLRHSVHRYSCRVLDEDLDTPSHLAEVSKCRIFVGHKTHSVVFALVAGTPLVALAYHPKTVDFMLQYGLEEHCICDDRLTAGALTDKFDEVRSRADTIGEHQFHKSCEFGRVVRSDFAQLLEEFAARKVSGSDLQKVAGRSCRGAPDLRVATS